MEKKPVQFAHNLSPFCPICGSGEWMENPDGNRNNFCGQCGTALDWDHAEDADTGEIVKLRGQWIPADEPPKTGEYVLLSFTNFDITLVGRYEVDDMGGAYCVGDDERSCISQNLIVNAWQPFPEPYRDDGEN